MKKNYSIILGIAACLLPALAVGQTSSPEMPNGNYLVVGAYLPGSENYLDLFMKGLQAKGLSPKSGFETKRNLLYVYLDVYQDFNESVNQMLKARQNPDLGNAWVRAIKDGTVAAIAVTKAISSETVVVKKQDP